jgi:hypothetical protein
MIPFSGTVQDTLTDNFILIERIKIIYGKDRQVYTFSVELKKKVLDSWDID